MLTVSHTLSFACNVGSSEIWRLENVVAATHLVSYEIACITLDDNYPFVLRPQHRVLRLTDAYGRLQTGYG